jgi:hypothetical protein
VSLSASDHQAAARVGARVIEEEIASAMPPDFGFAAADPARQRLLIELCPTERQRVRLRSLWSVMVEMRATSLLYPRMTTKNQSGPSRTG